MVDAKEEARRSDALYNDASGAITRRYLTDRLAACESLVKRMTKATQMWRESAITFTEYGDIMAECHDRARALGLL